MFVIGAVFAPIGGLLLYASAQVQELIIDYTDCQNAPSELTPIPSSRYNTYFTQNTSEFTRSPPTWSSSPFVQGIGLSNRLNYTTRQCTIEFYMPEALKPPVFMYYQLSNFYQNHRRYAQSYDQDQLMGKHPASDKLGTCSPLDKDDNGTIYYPCGLIANSVFNDSITAPTLLNPANTNSDQQTYNMTINGTSWGTDSALYVNGDATGYNTSEVVPPPFWKTRYPEGYNDDFPIPNLNTDDVFQNWMRAAALPTFVKLYRRNNEETMAIGRYQVNITYGMFYSSSHLCSTLTSPARRLPGRDLRRQQVPHDNDAHRHGRPQPVPRHRVHCHRGRVRAAGRHFHHRAPHQAQVRLSCHAYKDVSRLTLAAQKTRRPQLPLVEQRQALDGHDDGPRAARQRCCLDARVVRLHGAGAGHGRRFRWVLWRLRGHCTGR